MKKSLYFIVVVLLCVTTGAQLFAYEYDVQNTTNYEIAAQLIFNGPPGSSGKKVIAPKSTANFKMSGSNTA